MKDLTVRSLIDSAHEDLEQVLVSAGVSFILWNSFTSSEELKRNYLAAQNKLGLTDKRRTSKSIGENNEKFLALVDELSVNAEEYRLWIVKNNRQPLLKNIVVAYCAGVEGYLKRIAVAFALHEKVKYSNIAASIHDDDYKKTLESKLKSWQHCGKLAPSRAQAFFEAHIFYKNPYKNIYRFSLDLDDWNVCNDLFRLRNAIIHDNQILARQLEIGEYKFLPTSMQDITISHTDFISKVIRRIFDLGPKLHLL